MSDNKIDADGFCNLQGLNENDRFVMNKKYKQIIKTYNEWYDHLQHLFVLGPKKTFASIVDATEKVEVDKTNK